MKNKQCRTHRRSQGEPRGPCAPNFSISSHFVPCEAMSQTKVLLFAWSQTFPPPKFWVGYTTGWTSNDRDDKKLNRKNSVSSESKPRKALKTQIWGKTTGLALLAKSFWKCQKSHATYRTGQCDVILLFKIPFTTIQASNIRKLLQFRLIVWVVPQCCK